MYCKYKIVNIKMNNEFYINFIFQFFDKCLLNFYDYNFLINVC